MAEDIQAREREHAVEEATSTAPSHRDRGPAHAELPLAEWRAVRLLARISSVGLQRPRRATHPEDLLDRDGRAALAGGCRVDLRRGVLVAPKPTSLKEFSAAWMAGAEDGNIRNRSGDRYKPSTLRGYEQAMREYILPGLGAAKLQALRRQDIQRLADELAASGISPATLCNALLPLRAICRRALSRGDIEVNPTAGIEIPAVRGRRTRFATPREAQQLIDAAPAEDRVLWATAFYAGLRRGELQALRWEDVDLAGGVLHVRRSWDVKAGLIEPKSSAGRRKVPIAAILRDHLVDHRLNARQGLVFGRPDGTPFAASSIGLRAATAWKAAKLKPITLHECRHTFASLMIAAGVNPKALQTFMGHSSITITLDRDGFEWC